MMIRRTWPNLWVPRWTWLRALVDFQFTGIRRALARFPRSYRRLILDFGAGPAPYRSVLPPHQMYLTVDDRDPADFKTLDEVDPALKFDLILVLEVLEHLDQPAAMLKTLQNRLADEGEIWISVPLLAREHPAPDDFQRWTKQGLGRLCGDAGLEILELVPRGTDIVALAHFNVYHAFHSWLSWRTWPLAAVLTAALPFWLGVGHFALRAGWGRSEGPLGYVLRARPLSRTAIHKP